MRATRWGGPRGPKMAVGSEGKHSRGALNHNTCLLGYLIICIVKLMKGGKMLIPPQRDKGPAYFRNIL